MPKARLYADEGFPCQVSRLLRELGHDVLTVQEAGLDNQRIPDEAVLAFAISQNRAVLTINRVASTVGCRTCLGTAITIINPQADCRLGQAKHDPVSKIGLEVFQPNLKN